MPNPPEYTQLLASLPDEDEQDDGTTIVPTPKVTYRTGPGRPTTLTPVLIKAATRLHALGLSMPVLCKALGIPDGTYKEWNEKGKAHTARGIESPFASWWQGMEEAKGACEVNLLSMVVAGAATDYRAACWLLERRYAQRWGKPEHRLPRGEKDDLSAMSTGDLKKVLSGEIVPKSLAADTSEDNDDDESDDAPEDDGTPPVIIC